MGQGTPSGGRTKRGKNRPEAGEAKSRNAKRLDRSALNKWKTECETKCHCVLGRFFEQTGYKASSTTMYRLYIACHVSTSHDAEVEVKK